MNTQQYGKLYTSGNGDTAKAVSYNLEELNLLTCLTRVNKVSDTGLALTVAMTCSMPFESQVSKAGLEKGQVPIKKAVGEVLIFDVNIQTVDDRKPGEVNGRCQTLINALRGSMIKDGKLIALSDKCVLDGSIIRLTWDGASVPLKGIQKVKSFTDYLSDPEESIVFWEMAEEYTEDLDDAIKAEFEALNGSKYVERAGYQKGKTYEQLFLERLDFSHKVVTSPDGDVINKIAALTNEFPLWNDETLLWEYPDNGAIETVMLGILKV